MPFQATLQAVVNRSGSNRGLTHRDRHLIEPVNDIAGSENALYRRFLMRTDNQGTVLIELRG